MNSLLYSRSSSASRYAPVSLKLSRSLDIGGVKFTARLDKSQQVGCYSVHPSRGPPIVQYDASAIRRYKAPELQADLAIGGHNIIHRFSRPTIRTLDQPSSLDNTLNACLKGHKGARRALMRADVIARQNVIRRIMHGNARFYASYIDGKLFLEGKAYGAASDFYEGIVKKYSFIQHCTERFPWSRQGTDISSWNPIVTRNLGGLKLLMSGDIPCIDGAYAGKTDDYLEMKCTWDHIKLPSRLYKDWFLRLYLMGGTQMLHGRIDSAYRLTSGDLLSSEELLSRASIRDPANTAQDQPPDWTPESSIDYSFRALTTLRDYCQEQVDLLEYQYTPERDRIWIVAIHGKENPEARLEIRELTEKEKQTLRPQSTAPMTGIISTRVVDELLALGPYLATSSQ